MVLINAVTLENRFSQSILSTKLFFVHLSPTSCLLNCEVDLDYYIRFYAILERRTWTRKTQIIIALPFISLSISKFFCKDGPGDTITRACPQICRVVQKFVDNLLDY